MASAGGNSANRNRARRAAVAFGGALPPQEHSAGFPLAPGADALPRAGRVTVEWRGIKATGYGGVKESFRHLDMPFRHAGNGLTGPTGPRASSGCGAAGRAPYSPKTGRT